MAPRAENQMGRWGAVSYIVGNIIGSGIFITPATILAQTQSVGLALLIWLLSGAIATLGAYCYVELGTSIRRSGGDFAYLCHVRWNAIAFMFMIVGCVLIYPLMLAIQAETFAEYMVKALDVELMCPFWLHTFRKLISLAAIWLLLFINFFSVRRVGARFQIYSTMAKFLATILIVCTALYYLIFKGQTQNFHDPFANSNFAPSALVGAFFSGLFSYDGWDVLNFGAEDVQNPGKTMSFAILAGMFCVTSIYMVINLAFIVVLDAAEMQKSPAVAMTFATESLGKFSHFMPLLINLVMIGSMNGTIFTASRYLFAAARGRQIPAFIALTNRHHDSPRAALFVHVFMAFAFSFLGNINELINYLGFAQWLQRGFTMCALLWIRYGLHRGRKDSIISGLHPDAIQNPLFMPLMFLAVCTALIAVTLYAEFETAKYGLIILAVAFVVYFLFFYEFTLNRFELYRQISWKVNDRLACLMQILLNGQIEIADEFDELRLDSTRDVNSKTSEITAEAGKEETLVAMGNNNNKVFPMRQNGLSSAIDGRAGGNGGRRRRRQRGKQANEKNGLGEVDGAAEGEGEGGEESNKIENQMRNGKEEGSMTAVANTKRDIQGSGVKEGMERPEWEIDGGGGGSGSGSQQTSSGNEWRQQSERTRKNWENREQRANNSNSGGSRQPQPAITNQQ